MSFTRNLKHFSGKIWEDGYHHPFVQELGRGTLEKDRFRFYLLQDYHYLLQYAKVFALGAVKSEDEAMMIRLTKIQSNILTTELDIHRKYMNQFGIPHQQTAGSKPSFYNRAYTTSMLAVGQTGDLAQILASVLPCAWIYYDYASRLKEEYHIPMKHNFYSFWIESYSSQAFFESYQWLYDAIDHLVSTKNPAQKEAVQDIFLSGVEFEYLFWDMCYKESMSCSN